MSILNLLNQAVIIYPKSGYDKFGHDVSGAGVSTLARFQNKTKTKILPDQQIINLVGVVYFNGDVSINTEDRITYQGNSYKVFSISDSIDGRGNQRLIMCEVTVWQ